MLRFTSVTPHHAYLTRELSHTVFSASAARALDQSKQRNMNIRREAGMLSLVGLRLIGQQFDSPNLIGLLRVFVL